MSRKTRKLIWSAPLVAVLAVAAALAIFAVQAPSGAQAQEVMVPGSVTGLEATATSRTGIRLSWEAPDSSTGGTPTGYRIDHSDDNLVWSELEDNTGNTRTSFTVTDDVSPATRRHYRVFAINEAGTGPVSNDPVTAFINVGDTHPSIVPSRVTLSLTVKGSNQIDLSWTAPTDDGGEKVTGYKVVEMVTRDNPSQGDARVECGSAGVPSALMESAAPASATDCLLVGDVDSLADNPYQTGRTKSHKNLIAGSTHYYRVFAINAQGSTPSNVVGARTTVPTRPSSPQSPVAVPSGANTIDLFWVEPSSDGGVDLGPNEIEYQFDDGPDATADVTGWTNIEGHTGDNADLNLTITRAMDVSVSRNAQLTGLVVGSYKFRTRSKQSGDAESGRALTSGWAYFNSSRPVAVPLPNVTPVAAGAAASRDVPLMPVVTLKDIDAAAVEDQGIRLEWMPDLGADMQRGLHDGTPDDADPAMNDDGPQPSDYLIHIAKAPAAGATDQPLKWMHGQRFTVVSGHWEHEGLDDGDRWYYRVFPINGNVYGDPGFDTEDVDMANVASPDQVINLTATGISTTEIRLMWGAPTGADKYDIYVSELNDAGLAANWVSLKADVEVTTYTHDGLLPGDQRWYRVVAEAEGQAVAGADGAETLGETLDAGEPGVPIGLVAEVAKDSSFTSASDRGVLLLWNQPNEAGKDPHTGYTVQRMIDDGEWETLSDDTESVYTHYSDEDEPADADEQRAYRVAALSGSGAGDWSNVAYIPAKTAPPATAELTTPSLLNPRVVTVGGIKTISILWDSGEGEERQIVQLLTEDRMFVDSQTVMPDGETADFDNDGSGIAPGTYRVQIVALGMGTDFRNSGTVLVTVE